MTIGRGKFLKVGGQQDEGEQGRGEDRWTESLGFHLWLQRKHSIGFWEKPNHKGLRGTDGKAGRGTDIFAIHP